MDTTIFYFSSTGNSLDVAKVLQQKLDGKLVSMTAGVGQECNSNIVGFVYPTYFWGLPHLVEDFIKRLKITSETPYIFGVTCAKTSGGGLGSLNLLLKEKQYSLDYGKTIHSVSNYIVGYDVNLESVEKITSSARRQAEACAVDIMVRKKNNCKKLPLLTDWFHSFYLKRYGNGDQEFKITVDCVGCGICERVCPVHNIRLLDGTPTFLHSCEHCLACMHWCPQQAIQYGGKTQGRHRYHNPYIDLNELNR